MLKIIGYDDCLTDGMRLGQVRSGLSDFIYVAAENEETDYDNK
jgi:hypothetical protein